MLSIHDMHNLSRLSKSSFLQNVMVDMESDLAIATRMSDSKISKLSKLINILAGLYFLLEILLSLILSVSSKTLIIQALLAYTNFQYQILICLFWPTRGIGRPQSIMVNIFGFDHNMLIDIFVSSVARSSINGFWS